VVRGVQAQKRKVSQRLDRRRHASRRTVRRDES
jgi:hypothetical protein